MLRILIVALVCLFSISIGAAHNGDDDYEWELEYCMIMDMNGDWITTYDCDGVGTGCSDQVCHC